MGEERVCSVRLGRRRLEGKVLLEAQDLIFRGDERLAIPFREIRAATAAGGVLTVRFDEKVAHFEIGDAKAAIRWAEKIKNPKSVIDKLGVKPGMGVVVLGVDDEGFLEHLRARAGRVATRAGAAPTSFSSASTSRRSSSGSRGSPRRSPRTAASGSSGRRAASRSRRTTLAPPGRESASST